MGYWDDNDIMDIDFDDDWEEEEEYYEDTLFRQNGRKKFCDYRTAVSRLVDSLFDNQQAM